MQLLLDSRIGWQGGVILNFLILFFKFLFREREGKREGEKHQCVVASCMPPAGDLAPTQACALTGN